MGMLSRTRVPGQLVGIVAALFTVFAVDASYAVVASPIPKCDGTSDDTQALRVLIGGGGVVSLPSNKTCVVHGTIYISSNTTIIGNGATLLAAQPWQADYPHGYAIIEGGTYTGSVPGQSGSVSNVSIDNLKLDYGSFGAVPVPGGGKHAVRFGFTSATASNIKVTNSTFYLRGAEDAVAGLRVNSMVVKGNSAYEFRNCAWDFWGSPRNVSVVNNYAKTTTSAQVTNFNPELGVGSSQGNIASGFTLQGNTFIVTGSVPSAVQPEPLGAGTSVDNVLISGNKLVNAAIAVRGDTTNVQILGNEIDGIQSYSALMSYPLYGGTPANITFSGNLITNPMTAAGNVAVVVLDGTNSTIADNLFTGVSPLRLIYTYSAVVTETNNENDLSAVGAVLPGTVLKAGQSIQFGELRLTMQNDSNLVLYGPSGALWGASEHLGNYAQGAQPIHSCPSCYAAFQKDGNLVLYDPSFSGTNHAYWSSKTQRHPGAWFDILSSAPYLSVYYQGASIGPNY